MKQHKIIKFNLGDEVKQLQSAGMAYHEIASTIKDNHPEITDLSNLSAMAIQRYLKQDGENEIESSLKEGKDPIADFVSEYRQAMRDVISKTDVLYNETMELLKLAKDQEDNTMRLQALNTANKNLDTMRKNFESVIQNSNSRITSINNVNLKKEIHIKNLLIGFTKHLCPSCKTKISDVLDNEGV